VPPTGRTDITFSCGRLLNPPWAEVEPADPEPEFADADPEPVVVPLLLPDVLPPPALLPEPMLAPPLTPDPLPAAPLLPEPVLAPPLTPDALPPREPVLAPPLTPAPLQLPVALPPAAGPSIIPMISTRWPTYCSISRSRLPVKLNTLPVLPLALAPVLREVAADEPVEPLAPLALVPADDPLPELPVDPLLVLPPPETDPLPALVPMPPAPLVPVVPLVLEPLPELLPPMPAPLLLPVPEALVPADADPMDALASTNSLPAPTPVLAVPPRPS